MKTLILVLAVIIFWGGVCFAKTKYTKVSDTVLRIETSQIETKTSSDQVTIESLKAKKANLVYEKARFIESAKAQIINYDNQIAEVDTAINQAISLGIKEQSKEIIQ